jgi:hypothetical protein
MPLQEMFSKTSILFKAVTYTFALQTVLINISTGQLQLSLDMLQ